MANKPTYEELEQEIIQLKNKGVKRERAEKALRESEEKYRTLLENAGEAVLVAQDGVFKFSNPRGEELFGYSKGELVSKPFTSFIHQEDREMSGGVMKKGLKGKCFLRSILIGLSIRAGNASGLN